MSGAGWDNPPPEPPPDNRLRVRLEACRTGIMELDALRSKHSMMMQNLRSRLPVIPGSEDVQTRERKSREILDRSSIQSVDSGVSSLGQTTISTRCSTPEADDSLLEPEAYVPASMPYSSFRKFSLEQYIPNIMRRKDKKPPRPSSMYDYGKREEMEDETKKMNRRSSYEMEPTSPQRRLRTVQKPEVVVRCGVQKAQVVRNELKDTVSGREFWKKPVDVAKVPSAAKTDMMFRANFVILSSPPTGQRSSTLRFSPQRGRRTDVTTSSLPSPRIADSVFAAPCKIRSPQTARFASRPPPPPPPSTPTRTSSSSTVTQSTWLQSQPL